MRREVLAFHAAVALFLGLGMGCGTRPGVSVSAPAPETSEEPKPQTIQLGQDGKTFEVRGLDPALLVDLSKNDPSPERWSALLAVFVESKNAANRLPLLGTYRVDGQVLAFEPRFPLQPGLRYLAVLDPAQLPSNSGKDEPKVTAEFAVPRPPATPSTLLTQVYPTASRLPENQLKFYLHFSAPMSRGEAYGHIHLLDSAGKPIHLPFLELDEELWDPTGKRFTLFFDPGRIKRGLKPREEVGPALEEGKAYTLVIDADWNDAHGNPLRSEYRKAFQVGPPDDQPPDPNTWKLQPPTAGTTEPLVARFPKPMDHALLQRSLWISDAAGKTIPGTIAVLEEEKLWRFTPQQPWNAGAYQLVIETELEDLAGNSIGRPFEVDVLHPIQQKVETKTVVLPVQIK